MNPYKKKGTTTSSSSSNDNTGKRFLYTLQLEGGNYYVGVTYSVSRRFQEHKNGQGAEWTKLHRPMKILDVRPLPHDNKYPGLEEDKRVKELMMQFGTDKVRGGSYSKCALQPVQAKALQHDLRHAKDACLRCGRSGHYSTNCYARTNSDGRAIEEDEDEDEDVPETADNVACFNCGRPGHVWTECYTRTYSSEKNSSVTCFRCGRPGHVSTDCYATTHYDGEPVGRQNNKSKGCSRCGRSSHSSTNCYAGIDIDGNPLGGSGRKRQNSVSSSYESAPSRQRRAFCERCGRDGHIERSCYASRGIDGADLSSDEGDY